MSKRLGGNIGCKDKISSWHLTGFPDGSMVWAFLFAGAIFPFSGVRFFLAFVFKEKSERIYRPCEHI